MRYRHPHLDGLRDECGRQRHRHGCRHGRPGVARLTVLAVDTVTVTDVATVIQPETFYSIDVGEDVTVTDVAQVGIIWARTDWTRTQLDRAGARDGLDCRRAGDVDGGRPGDGMGHGGLNVTRHPAHGRQRRADFHDGLEPAFGDR